MRDRVEVVVREAEVAEEGGVEEGAMEDRVRNSLSAESDQRCISPPKTRSGSPWRIRRLD
jgi:hypothetical protein